MCYDHGMTTPKSWAVRGSGVIHQQFDGEGVVIDLETGNYYSMPGAAGVLWHRLTAGAASAANLADELVAVFEVERSIALADATSKIATSSSARFAAEAAPAVRRCHRTPAAPGML